MIDVEGFINTRYRKDRGTIFPRLRIYGTSSPIVVEAARIMDVNPFPRRDHGRLVGWYASVSHQKALRVLRRAAPFLRDQSKKCRTAKILKSFPTVAAIKGSQTVAEFFRECPLPTRLRGRPKI